MRRTDSTGEIGDYYGKADLRLTMRFDRAIPFDLTTIKTGASDGSTCATSLNISSNRMGRATAENRVSYEDVTSAGVLPTAVRTTFKGLLDRLKAANPGDTALQTALSNTGTIAALPPATIAAIRMGCFLPAPIQKLDTAGSNPYDLREDREMKLLQSHLESLTVWNRDGVYVDFDTNLNTAGTATTANIEAAFDDEASCGNLGATEDAAYCTNRNARTNTDTTFRRADLKYFSGAFHNYVRMLEQWTVDEDGDKVEFTYRGSMVNLGLPQEFNGLAVWENVYDMPDRDWGFDLLFNSFDKLPPLTPRVVYLKQDVFKRSY